jgi:hypothetical protein
LSLVRYGLNDYFVPMAYARYPRIYDRSPVLFRTPQT